MTRAHHEKDPQDIVAAYQRDIERWREKGASYKDIQPLTTQDVMFIRLALHPTSKRESKELTRAMINYLCDKGICTVQELQDNLGYSDKPLLKRLKILRQLGLVRRESKKWYLPTPRMIELCNRYLARICG